MTASLDTLSPKILIVASNPAMSQQTRWPIGFWWAELTHPYWSFTERGYIVAVASPDGGPLRGGAYSDPRDPSGYSAEDLISLGFINSPSHMALIEQSTPLSKVHIDNYDALVLVGEQGPMYTFYNDHRVHRLAADFYEAGKITAVLCHATAILLKARTSDGRLIVKGRTWTGFANTEEDYAMASVMLESQFDEAALKRASLLPDDPARTGAQ